MKEFRMVVKVVGTHALINGAFVAAATAMLDLYKLYRDSPVVK